MSGEILLPTEGGSWQVPTVASPDVAVAANFERFDGLTPLDHPAGGPHVFGSPSRPGFNPTPDEYTPGPVAGVVGVVGGMPLPTSDRIFRPPGGTTLTEGFSIQYRLGVGQHGPSELAVAQTVQLARVTNNPPVPNDLDQILAGLA